MSTRQRDRRPVDFLADSFWAPAEALRAQYNLDVEILPDENRLRGQGSIHLVNPLEEPIKKLALEGPRYGHGSYSVHTVGLAKSERRDEPVPTVLTLPRPLESGETVVLKLEFETRLMVADEGVMLLYHWYPRLWWGYPTADAYRVSIHSPPSWEGVGSGQPCGQFQWQGQGMRTFGAALGSELEILRKNAGLTRVAALSRRTNRAGAERLLEIACDVIHVCRDEFGFYPHSHLAITPGYAHSVGGFNLGTGVICVHSQQDVAAQSDLYWQWIMAHEIGHMYWGEHILEKGSDFWMLGGPNHYAEAPGWLWIAMGLYVDWMYFRRRNLSAAMHDKLLDHYREGMQRGHDTTVERPYEQLEDPGFDYNNVVVHGKGFAFLMALEGLLGQEAFGRIYRRCLREYGGRRLGPAQFQLQCERETGQDLEWFFSQWLRSSRYPGMDIDRGEGQVQVKPRGGMLMPAHIEVQFDGDKVQSGLIERVPGNAEVILKGSGVPTDIRMDPPVTHVASSGMKNEEA